MYADSLFHITHFTIFSTYNLVSLTLERYLAVVHPIWHKMKFTKTKVIMNIYKTIMIICRINFEYTVLVRFTYLAYIWQLHWPVPLHLQVKISILAAWIIGPIYNMAFMIPTAAILDDGSCTVYSQYPSLTTQRAVGVFTIVIQYFLPLGILIFFYVRMALALRRKVAPSTEKVRHSQLKLHKFNK